MGKEVDSWWLAAECRGMDTALFFPVNGDYSSVRPVCDSCRVRVACLEDALRQELDAFGFFGGMTPKDRDKVRLERMRYGYRPGEG